MEAVVLLVAHGRVVECRRHSLGDPLVRELDPTLGEVTSPGSRLLPLLLHHAVCTEGVSLNYNQLPEVQR